MCDTTQTPTKLDGYYVGLYEPTILRDYYALPGCIDAPTKIAIMNAKLNAIAVSVAYENGINKSRNGNKLVMCYLTSEQLDYLTSTDTIVHAAFMELKAFNIVCAFSASTMCDLIASHTKSFPSSMTHTEYEEYVGELKQAFREVFVLDHKLFEEILKRRI